MYDVIAPSSTLSTVRVDLGPLAEWLEQQATLGIGPLYFGGCENYCAAGDALEHAR